MIFSPPGTSDLAAWARRLVDDLNRFGQSPLEWPVFDDDAAASAGRVKVGEGYRTPGGEFRWRVS